jgi:hypothetical protein
MTVRRAPPASSNRASRDRCGEHGRAAPDMRSITCSHQRSPFQFPGQLCELHPNAGGWLQRLGGALMGARHGVFRRADYWPRHRRDCRCTGDGGGCLWQDRRREAPAARRNMSRTGGCGWVVPALAFSRPVSASSRRDQSGQPSHHVITATQCQPSSMPSIDIKLTATLPYPAPPDLRLDNHLK